MQRSECLEAASKRSGRKAAYHHLWYATKLGYVDEAPVQAGWKEYDERHVSQLADYLTKHSRKRRELSK